MAEGEVRIRSIQQFSIRRISADCYNLVFIFIMTDDSMRFAEHMVNLERASEYLRRKEWMDYLPTQDGQAVDVVMRGYTLPSPSAMLATDHLKEIQ
jgi:hypothetical protein